MRKPFLKNVKNVVIKVGTSVLTRAGRFDERIVKALADEISVFLKRGMQVSVVSSGAIGAGMTILKLKRRPVTIEGLQGAAAVGQRHLMTSWERAFSRRGFSTAQVLLTWDDLADKKRHLNARQTLKQIQKWGLVPVVNENDTVATDEIRFGDNDRLSSLLAILIEADLLIILSDTNGVYQDADRADESKRIKVVERMGDSVFAHVSDRRNKFTTGGMRSKLQAVHSASSSGIPVFVANGKDRKVLTRLLKADDLGTFFLPDTKKGNGRRDWAEDFANYIRTVRK